MAEVMSGRRVMPKSTREEPKEPEKEGNNQPTNQKKVIIINMREGKKEMKWDFLRPTKATSAVLLVIW